VAVLGGELMGLVGQLLCLPCRRQTCLRGRSALKEGNGSGESLSLAFLLLGLLAPQKVSGTVFKAWHRENGS
jgi:hypothetical protein